MRESPPKKESKSDAPKSVPKSISLPPDMLADVEKVVDSKHGGNLSRYIQSLIEADLNRAENRAAFDDGMDKVIIDHLAVRYHPSMAPVISETLVNQRLHEKQMRLLALLLEALPDLLSGAFQTYEAKDDPLATLTMREAFLTLARVFKK